MENEDRVNILYEQAMKDHPDSPIFKNYSAFLIKIKEGNLTYVVKVLPGISQNTVMRVGRCHYLFLDKELEISMCKTLLLPLLNLKGSKPVEFLQF